MKFLKVTTLPCIYLITNTINGKRYVGQTVRFKDRMWEHEHNNNRYISAIDAAIKKYGTNVFEVSILETPDKELLDEREEYWIKKLGTYRFEYNLNKGGHGRGSLMLSQPVIQYSYDYSSIIYRFDSLSEAGIAMHGSYVTIRACCLNDNGHGGQILHAYGYGWGYENITQEELKYRHQETMKTAFYSINLSQNEVPKLYFTQVQAGKELKVNPACIKNILRKRAKTTKSLTGIKYTFRWYKDIKINLDDNGDFVNLEEKSDLN